MTLHFAASDTHAAIYVVSGNQTRAKAWVQRQASPARYQHVHINHAYRIKPQTGEQVIGLIGDLDHFERAALQEMAAARGWDFRKVYA